MNVILKMETVSVEEFKLLRKSVGWPVPPDAAIETSLKNSVYCVSAYITSRLVGMGRIIGDNGFTFFISDIIVLPEYQGNNIGRCVMTSIIEYLKESAPENSYIVLMAAKGKEKFYEKFGFIERPTEKLGSGMMLDVDRL